MRFEVVWMPDAGDQLQAILSSLDSRPVIRAAERLDSALCYCPTNVGESREDNERIAFEPPLCITYEVLDVELRVNILRVRAVQQPGQ